MRSFLTDLLAWTELLATFDVACFAAVSESLRRAGIPFRTRTAVFGHGTRRGGTLSALGEKPEYSTQYRILVKKADLSAARNVQRNSRVGD